MPNRRRHLLLRCVVVAVAAGLPVAVVGCTDNSAPTVKLSAEGTVGKAVAQKFNCQSCHSVSGEELTGPTWKGLYGKKVTLTTGKTVTIDADYIKRAIREPNAERREDSTGQMPTFDTDRISDHDLTALVTYIEELGGPAPATK